jgi:hypothetical protein
MGVAQIDIVNMIRNAVAAFFLHHVLGDHTD